ARPLDGHRHHPLVPGAHARQAARENLPALRREAREGPFVLVIHYANAGLTDRAGLPGPSHSSPSPSPSSSVVRAALGARGASPSFSTSRWRMTASSSFTARSNSTSCAGLVLNWTTT